MIVTPPGTVTVELPTETPTPLPTPTSPLGGGTGGGLPTVPLTLIGVLGVIVLLAGGFALYRRREEQRAW